MADRPVLDGGTEAVERRRALQRAAGAGVPSLVYDALGDDDFAVRQEAVRLAVKSGHDGAVLAALERALCDEASLSRRSSAMEAFGKLGALALPSLARLALDGRPGVRRLAVDALGQGRVREGFDVLSARASDDSAAVRAAALEALSRLGDERSLQRIEEVTVRRDEPATVVLAGLIALDSVGRVLPPSRIRPHLADPLTAAPALRLLGRAGDPGPLVDVLDRASGARRRAAAVGLGYALDASPESTRALLARSRDRLDDPLLELCAGADVTAASAALYVAATLGLGAALVVVARRADRSSLLSAAHRAAALLARAHGSGPAAHGAVAHGVHDADVTGFLEDMFSSLPALAEPSPAAHVLAADVLAAMPRVATPALPGLAGGERPTLGEAELARLAGLFHRHAGLLFEAHAAWRVEARLAPRLKACGCPTWASYVALLERDDDGGRAELAQAIERVTVHETYFFRERYQLESFAGEVLTAMAPLRKGELPGVTRVEHGLMRVLSAGCSTGEEAWTLAMLLEESGLFGASLAYEIVGLDIAPSIIEAARAGRYGKRGFRGDMPPESLARWFREEGANRVVVDRLRRNVSFHVGNLLDAADMAARGRFDVVFCRNVLIYMSDEARARIVTHFFERLKPGGVLFLGHSESLLNVDSGFRFLPLKRELAYVRPTERAQRSRP